MPTATGLDNDDTQYFATSPLTEAQLLLRKQRVHRHLVEMHYTPEDIATTSLTCDGCANRGTCLYSYDLYNTNGDCLADK